ncbi:helicase [EBPR siphovirus 2]|nr:helicase [EBPR siphovirus 2]
MLADAPRVGKTGAAIIASDLVIAGRILVITTKSGQGVWKRGFETWQDFLRAILIATPQRIKLLVALRDQICAVIVSWKSMLNPTLRAELLSQQWDVLIPDEDHYAKNFDSKRTQALYGTLDRDGALLMNQKALYARAERVWPLTGTPYPHDLSDGYTRLRALAPHLLLGKPERGWPDVTKRGDFTHRYCIVRMKKISNFRSIPVVIGGKNEAEFRERFSSFLLRRTQKDVGIQPPRQDFLPLIVDDSLVRQVNQMPGVDQIVAAINVTLSGTKDKDAITTSKLDMHLGPLMRLTGTIKAHAVVEAVQEEFECGLDRIVLAYWHRDVGDILHKALAEYGVLRVDGSTSEADRENCEANFRAPNGPRVFLAQIAAAGEALDLSASAELWFVETVISPKGMSQMSLRITNKTQTRTPVVKVCTLAGSIDEALQASLMRLVESIDKGTSA